MKAGANHMIIRTALPLALTLAATIASAQQEIVEFVELDAVGNILVVTDAQGNVVEEHDYDPYGQELCGTPPNMVPCATMPAGQNRRFTGKERDKETGLDYFGARYYQANVGRFTSVDPVMDRAAALRDPQKWNRYAYSRNNPLKFVDPDGRNEAVAIMGAPLVQSRMTSRQQALAGYGRSASDAGTLAGGAVLMSAAGAAMAPAIATEIGIAARGCMASAGCQNALRGVAEDLSGAPSGTLGVVPRFRLGHTFTKHGAEMTEQLLREAQATGRTVGQWVDDAAAREFISGHLDELKSGAKTFDLPDGLGRLVQPDGSFVSATKARLVPSGRGVKTAYPE